MRYSKTRRRTARATAAKTWPTEGALCDQFASEARAQGFRVHAETSGWDLLLVDADGGQVGIQAKLRPNVEVLAQALGHGGRPCPGPDHHAVLVPLAAFTPAFAIVARELRLVILDAEAILVGDRWDGRKLSIVDALERAPIWEHTERAWVPELEVHALGGGRAGPVQLTPWKIAALKLCRILRRRGYLTRADFAQHKVSVTWWVQGPTAVLTAKRIGKQSRYVPSGNGVMPDQRWPEVSAALDRHLRELSQ